jgi:hypothetical protein
MICGPNSTDRLKLDRSMKLVGLRKIIPAQILGAVNLTVGSTDLTKPERFACTERGGIFQYRNDEDVENSTGGIVGRRGCSEIDIEKVL